MTASASAPAAGRPPLWTRDFVLVSVGYLFVSMIFYLLMTAMALYAVERFGASDTEAGLVVGCFVLGAVATRLITPPAMEAYGRRRTMVVAMVLYVLSTAAYLLASSLPLLVAVRFVQGMCFGAGGTVLATAVQSIIPPSRRSEGTGWFSSAMTLSSAFGPMTALIVSERFGYDWLFVVATAITVGALAVGLLLRLPEPTPTGRMRFRWAHLFSVEAMPISLLVALASLLYAGGVLAFLASYAQQNGISAGTTSLFFVLFAAGTLTGRFVLGPLHDRRGDNTVAYPVIVGYAASFAVIALWQSPAGLLVAGAMFGLSHGPLFSIFQTIAVSQVPATAVGVATGTFFLLVDLGAGLGPMVLGAVSSVTGLGPLYLGSAVCMAALAGVYWLVHGRRPSASVPREV